MDVNYMLLRQQVERSRAEAAASEEARKAHHLLASEYERLIQEMTGGNISFEQQRSQSQG